jgi:hypothetical protein
MSRGYDDDEPVVDVVATLFQPAFVHVHNVDPRIDVVTDHSMENDTEKPMMVALSGVYQYLIFLRKKIDFLERMMDIHRHHQIRRRSLTAMPINPKNAHMLVCHSLPPIEIANAKSPSNFG